MPDARSVEMISVDHLTKRYGPTVAVNDISFTVAKGEVLGFLGPNGAGKSTTMKILTTFLAPTAGTARIAGLDVYDRSLEVRRKIGYLPEDTPLYKDMAIVEYLRFVCEVRGVPRSERAARIKRVAEQCGIGAVAGKPIGTLSRGYRQRVGLAQALVHEPDVLILDEPTSGLDPNQIVEIRQLIKQIGSERTVILSTHILPEVTATCSRVVIISDGRLVADGRPDDLMAREKTDRYRVLFDGSGLDEAAVLQTLRALPAVREVARDTSESGTLQVLVTSDGQTDLRRSLFQAAVLHSWPLLELDRREASLEQVFRRLTVLDADGARAYPPLDPKPDEPAKSDDPPASAGASA